jgi:hypothetical protein
MFKHLKSTYKFLKKMMNKEVKDGEKHPTLDADHDIELSDLRKRKKKVETSRLKGLKKEIKAKKPKKLHQHRMRSTPGEVEGRESAPSNAHKEGLRWIKNSRKKTANNTKVFIKTSNKR